ncbi:protein-glutamate methylesterase/protein-glutamine glutaminase [Roseovarius sp.]|uniref:protein-glutamate methylesterase/protein-glutamine glutaminase n=1 Tax=Roseovarius sp. TaxID=1486281 RepID=UPI003A96CD05
MLDIACKPQISVLIVDDSASARAMLMRIVETDPTLKLFGTAADAFIAVSKMRSGLPDVMLLDMELPRMSGLDFLRKIMAQRPIPVVICSSHAAAGSDLALTALASGAVEVVSKPAPKTDTDFQESAIAICDAIHAAAETGVNKTRQDTTPRETGTKLLADALIPPARPKNFAHTSPIVCIGASTGGTEAIRSILVDLPVTCPPVVIVQHMPAGFTAAFARRLNGLCQVNVKEASDGDVCAPGEVLIAPGNYHMMLARHGRGYAVKIVEGPYICRHRPSVDILFRTAAQTAGPNALGVILTGMGDDGARCLREMRDAGATTLAQTEESCVVFGMPREAIRMGAATRVVALSEVPGAIASFASSHQLRTR